MIVTNGSKHEQVSDYILTHKPVLIAVCTVVFVLTSIITWNVL
jgi:hypothetical protein